LGLGVRDVPDTGSRIAKDLKSNGLIVMEIERFISSEIFNGIQQVKSNVLNINMVEF
jgi:hypothetical protein